MGLNPGVFFILIISAHFCSWSFATDTDRLKKIGDILLAEKVDIVLDTYRFSNQNHPPKQNRIVEEDSSSGIFTALAVVLHANPAIGYGLAAYLEIPDLVKDGWRKYFARTTHSTASEVTRYEKYTPWRWLGMNYTASVMLSTMAYLAILAGKQVRLEGFDNHYISTVESQGSLAFANLGALAYVYFSGNTRDRFNRISSTAAPAVAASYLGFLTVRDFLLGESDQTSALQPEDFETPLDTRQIEFLKRTARALRIEKDPLRMALLKEFYQEWEASGKNGDWIAAFAEEPSPDGEPLVDPLQLEALQKSAAFSSEGIEAVLSNQVEFEDAKISLKKMIEKDILFIEANQARLEKILKENPSPELARRLHQSRQELRRVKLLLTQSR